MNPFNLEAGMTPFPIDPLEVAVTEAAAKLMWRSCPYFEWRYGERGRKFGRSDAGFIVTLAQLPVQPSNSSWTGWFGSWRRAACQACSWRCSCGSSSESDAGRNGPRARP